MTDYSLSNPEYSLSSRGFRHYEPIPTDGGHDVRIYESSRAIAPCLWLDVTLTEDGARRAHTNVKPESATAHLTLDQARAIRNAFNAAIANHYQIRTGAKRRHAMLTAMREAMDRELKMDPMAIDRGFMQDSAARVFDAMERSES